MTKPIRIVLHSHSESLIQVLGSRFDISHPLEKY